MRYVSLPRSFAACAAASFVSCTAPAPAPPAPLDAIEAATERLEPELIALRRDLHQNPELSGFEQRTANLIEQQLRRLGLEVRSEVGGHGVIGVLHGARPGPTVAYRADMDAMPGDEPSGRPYGSRVPGVFHICGHDLHTAIGIGIASVLTSERERLPGTVLFLFQPAEETLEGAAAMLEDGALDAPAPDAIFAVHSFPFPVGTIARNVDFGGLDQFEAMLSSEVDDAALERAIDRLHALGTAARPGPGDVAGYLEQLLAEPSPLAGAVYMNVEIDDGRRLTGSWRAEDDAKYPALRAEIERILESELGTGAYQLTFRPTPFPSLRSNATETARAAASLSRAIGESQVLTLHRMHLFSGEDFALFVQRAPGAMFLVGVANAERGILGAPHFPDFDVDEAAIGVATRAMSFVLWERLAAR